MNCFGAVQRHRCRRRAPRGSKRRRVRAGARLGQAVARQMLHRAQLRQPAPALRVGAEAVDHPRGHVVDGDVGRNRGAACRQRLEDQRRVEPRQPRAAHIFSDIDAAHAERRRLAHHLDGEVLSLVPCYGVRRELLRRELARHVADGEVIIGEGEEVRGAPSARSGTYRHGRQSSANSASTASLIPGESGGSGLRSRSGSRSCRWRANGG